MEFRTLFRAYKRANSHKLRAAQKRGGTFGIACGTSETSKTWQRYDRLTRRINARIEGEEICPICVAWRGSHYSTCPDYEETAV